MKNFIKDWGWLSVIAAAGCAWVILSALVYFFAFSGAAVGVHTELLVALGCADWTSFERFAAVCLSILTFNSVFGGK